jgi:type IV secretion system protein VirB10
LPGEVNRHFWQRFGAAILISTIDGAVQAGVQSASRGNGAVIYNPSPAQDVTSEVLKNTLSIAPTVTKNNGDRIQVLVARDVDFSSVYELRRAAGSP